MSSAVELLQRGWGRHLAATVAAAQESVIIASPFIREPSARWLATHLADSVSVSVLTDIRADSIGSGSLDVSALTFLSRERGATITTLRGMHAKVIVADNHAAVITSGNLTPSGIDRNFEYGVRLTDPVTVRQARDDLERYSTLGVPLDTEALGKAATIADRLRAEHAEVVRGQPSDSERRLREVIRQADRQFMAAQVGSRSATRFFRDALAVALDEGPKTTAELAPIVQSLIPDFCDDTEELVINGQHFGKAWKHRLRNAQQAMKRAGEVTYDAKSRTWRLAPA
ncbi:MAG: hypothetical protein AMXMBFR23_18710 [Chloroflexota bacterium]